MCGSFILLTDLSIIVETFRIAEVACPYRTGGAIFPGQPVSAVIKEGVNKLVDFRWGLIPSWSRDPSVGKGMFNARAETLAQKPSFKEAFRRRRCLVLADGFYEWQRSGRLKIPLQFSLKSGRPFGMAGLYETWFAPGEGPIRTCTIITTKPNDLIRPVHDRMPVILGREAQELWLDPRPVDPGKLAPILKPYPAEEMAVSNAGLPGGDLFEEPCAKGA